MRFVRNSLTVSSAMSVCRQGAGNILADKVVVFIDNLQNRTRDE
jgi:hypothetical protein